VIVASDQGGLKVRIAQDAPIPLRASFACPAGRVLGLVGPSGSGKTTLLRCIAGLYQPQRGRVECRGATWLDTTERTALAPQQRRVGFVFQNYALFPHLSAEENVIAAMSHVARSERTRRARALLARVHLAGLNRRRPAELSGGQQQRVAVARALANKPPLVLADEPTGNLDEHTADAVLAEFLKLVRGEGSAALVATHNERLASKMDRVVRLHEGRLE